MSDLHYHNHLIKIIYTFLHNNASSALMGHRSHTHTHDTHTHTHTHTHSISEIMDDDDGHILFRSFESLTALTALVDDRQLPVEIHERKVVDPVTIDIVSVYKTSGTSNFQLESQVTNN